MQNEMVGRKVIVRSNEYDNPLLIGTLVGFVDLGLPIVKSESSGEDLMCGGVVIPHTNEMHGFLLTLSGKRQWAILRDIAIAIKVIQHGCDKATETRAD